MHPDQAQNTSSGIQGQEATAVAVIYVTAPYTQTLPALLPHSALPVHHPVHANKALRIHSALHMHTQLSVHSALDAHAALSVHSALCDGCCSYVHGRCL